MEGGVADRADTRARARAHTGARERGQVRGHGRRVRESRDGNRTRVRDGAGTRKWKGRRTRLRCARAPRTRLARASVAPTSCQCNAKVGDRCVSGVWRALNADRRRPRTVGAGGKVDVAGEAEIGERAIEAAAPAPWAGSARWVRTVCRGNQAWRCCHRLDLCLPKTCPADLPAGALCSPPPLR